MPLLWFDVGIKRYTTEARKDRHCIKLWFDVGIKRYTTAMEAYDAWKGCGLMQESKDIQHYYKKIEVEVVVV